MSSTAPSRCRGTPSRAPGRCRDTPAGKSTTARSRHIPPPCKSNNQTIQTIKQFPLPLSSFAHANIAIPILLSRSWRMSYQDQARSSIGKTVRRPGVSSHEIHKTNLSLACKRQVSGVIFDRIYRINRIVRCGVEKRGGSDAGGDVSGSTLLAMPEKGRVVGAVPSGSLAYLPVYN